MANPLKVGIVILLLLYPFLIYFGLDYFTPSHLGLFFLALFILRVIFTKTKSKTARWQLIFTVVIGGILAILTWIFDSEEFLLWYPVGLSAAFFLIFTISIIFPPTVIEQIARGYSKHFPPIAVVHTRNVTIVWAVFFAINIFVSSWTVVYGGMEVWTLYNGLISYIIVGILVGGELLVRRRMKKKHYKNSDE